MKRILKFLFFAGLTGFFVFVLEFGIKLGSKPLPPLGKLTHPFWGYLNNAVNADKGLDKEISLSGVKDEVTIVYDDRLVPHIYARNQEDLFFAQGYVTAMHRLWQMDFQVRAAAGRLSEIVNSPRVLWMDRLARNKGLAWSAENSVKVFENDPATKPILDAYTAGVNAYIESITYKDYPIEYKILDYQPEKWNTFKSALLLKYMGDMLTGRATDVALTNALKIVGQDNMNLFFPDFQLIDTVVSPIIPRGTPYTAATQFPDTPSTIGLYNTLSPYPEKYVDGIGSNNWAVSGAKTKSGKPILCNDPHLGLNLPSIWFEMQLNAPGYNAYGVTIPGSPAIIIGFNDSISWGVTNGTQDVMDYYRIQYKDASKKEYLFDGQWKQITTRIEEIKVKRGKTVVDTIRYTHFGPVINNTISDDTTANDLAIRWSVHDPANELKTFIMLNQADNYDQYVAAIKSFESPGQNFVFASVSGDIAIWHQGKYPVRFNQMGKYIMDGTKSIYQWNKYIPQEENPHVKNPERNFVSSANQHPTDGTYPYYYYGRFEHYRNRRINKVLADNDSITVEDMMRLQNDNYNLQAEESLPLMLAGLDSTAIKPENKKYYDALRSWNYVNDPESSGAPVYEHWFDYFARAVWDEFQPNSITINMEMPQDYTLIRIMRQYPNHVIFDDQFSKQKIETMRDLLLQSFNSACVELRNWETSAKDKPLTWANFKGTAVRHIALIPSFGVYNLNIGGNSNIVNAASANWGPSWRMIVSMEAGIKAYGVYPGGQSGNPASKFYKTGIEKWTKGEYFELNFWGTKDIALSKKMNVQMLKKK